MANGQSGQAASIATEIPWTPLVVLGLLIFAAYICKKYVGYSNVNFLQAIAKEIKDVVKRDPTPRAINGVIILVNAILVGVYFASATLEKLVRLMFQLNSSPASYFGEFIASVFVFSVVGLLCLLICESYKPK